MTQELSQAIEVLRKTKENIKSELSGNKQTNLKRLEKYLNNLFYPKDPHTKKRAVDQKKYLTLAEFYYNEMIELTKKVLKSAGESSQTKQRRRNVELARIQLINLQKNVNDYIEKAGHLKKLTNGDKLLMELNAFKIKLDTIINQLPETGMISDQDLLVNINTLLSYTQFFKKNPELTNDAKGKIFEQSLIRAINNEIDKTAFQLIAESTGQKPQSRGVGEQVFTYKGDGIDIQYNTGGSKQGKMDVKITVKKEEDSQWKVKSQWRVSAKSWGDGKGDFGATDIYSGITRAAGLSITEKYADILRTGYKEAAKEAHQFARWALVSDIVAGLNQKEGYANVIVIDTGSNIKVRDVYLVCKQKVNHISNYKNETINDWAYNARELSNGELTKYYYHLFSSLKAQKVTVTYSVK